MPVCTHLDQHQIYGQQHRINKYTRQQRLQFQLDMQKPRKTPRGKAAGKRHEQADPRIHPAENKYAGHDPAEGHRAVYRKIGEIKYAVGKIHAKGKNGIFKAFLQHDLYNIDSFHFITSIKSIA